MITSDNELLKKMVAGEYPVKIVKTAVGDFEVKYPTGDEEGRIERLKSLQLNGMSRSSFDIDFLNNVHRDCSLGVVISKYPQDFPKEMKGDNFDNYPLKEVKNSILKEFNIFYTEIQETLSGKPT